MLGEKTMSSSKSPDPSEPTRYIYFNPNYSINNINVKVLVERAKRASECGSVINDNKMDISEVPPLEKITPEHAELLNHPSNLVIQTTSAPPGGSSSYYKYEEYCDIWDPSHPWYPRNIRYPENLLSLAADYVLRPGIAPKCRLPPLSKSELIERMDMIYRSDNLRNAMKLKSQREKFVRYLKLLKEQVQFESLRIDPTRQSYAQCRSKRKKMLELGVNEYYYINENAVDDIYERERTKTSKIKKHPGSRKLSMVLLSNTNAVPIPPSQALRDMDSSSLSSDQRRQIFRQHVLRSGKNRYIKFDSKFRFERSSQKLQETRERASPQSLIHINKFKCVNQHYTNVRRNNRLCRSYLKFGWCKYGARCLLIHDKNIAPKRKFDARSKNSKYRVNNTTFNSVNIRSSTCSSSKTLNHTPSSFRFVREPTLGPKHVGLHKKIVNKALKWKVRTAEQKQTVCPYFARKGTCAFGSKCRKKHDPREVALCMKYVFSRKCTIANCKLQHKVSISRLNVTLIDIHFCANFLPIFHILLS